MPARSGPPRPGRLGRAITVAAVVTSIGMTGLAVPVTASAAPTSAPKMISGPVDDGSVSDEDKALQQAQSSGQSAEVVSARTEISDEWANPDGTFSVKRYGAPVRVWRDGTWIPTDPSLAFAADGTVVPKAASVSVVFSGGGSGPLLTGVKDGRSLSLSWPTALPQPTLAGNIATYAEVLPGVDLQLKAEVDGFSQLLVVKTAEAAQNPALTTLRYKTDTVGLSVSTDPDSGSLTAVNPAGQTVFSSPAPLMWDSTTVSSAPALTAMSTTTTEAAADSFDPAPGAQDAQMPTTVSGDTIEITPDQQLLTATTTQYPVYIDPSWAWGKRENWTRVYKKYPTSSFWNANEVARVGYENETYGLSRSFFQMDTSNIKGAGVITSTFRIKNVWSWSCQSRPVELWQTGSISKKTTWNNQPGKIGTTPLYTVNDAKGWSSTCPGGNLEFDATAKIREAASKNWSSITLGMYASDESDTYGWKKFDAKTAVLETKYNHPPKTPYSLGTNPTTKCANGGLIGNTKVSLFGTVDDPDAGNLTAQFQVFASGSTTPVVDQSISALKRRVATLPVPDASLPTGDYTWKARAKDNLGEYSSWSATCKFSVDRTRPANAPQINSGVFPPGDSGWPAGTGTARTKGDFTLAPNGVSDVVEYGWYSDDEPEVKYAQVPAGGTATVQITPPGYGPHFAYAFSIDKAGNRSDTTAYLYYAAGTGVRDVPGDLNGDGNNDIWNIDSNGTLLTYAGQGNSQFSTATNGGQSFDTGQVTSRGDWGKDGYNDLITLEDGSTPGTKGLWAYPNNGQGIATTDYKEGKLPLQVSCPIKDPDLGCDYGDDWNGDDHWHDADQIIAPGDINGDSKPDLLVKEGKLLWAYYGDDTTKYLDMIREPVLVGSNDWDNFTVIAPGDLNADNIADLILRDNTTGDLLRSYGKKGPDGVLDPTTWGDTAGRVKIGSGFSVSGYPVLGSAGDVTGDGIPDLWVRKTDNTMTGWPGKDTGTDFTGWGTSFTIDGITGGSRIPAGTTLRSGDTFTSRSAKLTMQADGNLVITSNANKILWSAGTSGNAGAQAVMQPSGSLVVNTSDGSTVLWSSKSNQANSYALLQDRGNLVVYNVKGQSQWSSGSAIRHDYNGDGYSDMADWYDFGDGSDGMHTFKANSDGTFQAPFTSYTSAAGNWYVEHMKFATGDYNGDGRSDMAALYGYSDGSVKLFTALSKTDGGFNAPFSSWSARAGNWSFDHMTVESGDFNGDGRDDLGVWYAYGDGSDKLFTYTANVQGGFNAPFSSYYIPPGSWDVLRSKFVTGDFDGDGRDDIAALYGYGDGSVRMHTFLTAPTGAFTASLQSWGGTATSWGDWNRTYLQAGDFNGDGRDDVAAWYDYADGHDALRTLVSDSNADGSFDTPTQSWDSAAGNWYYPNMKIVAGDYNGDGRDDLGAMYGYSDGTVRMFTWTATPTGGFNSPQASWSTATGWTFSRVNFLNRYN